MKRSKLLILLTIIVGIAVPFSVYAATSDTTAARTVKGFLGIDTSKLTDKQKAAVEDYSKKMADLKKEFINEMVANGSMTKEQGDAAVKRVDDILANREENGSIGGMGMRKGHRGGYGKQGDFGINRIDASKLTDQQKADLNNTFRKITDLHKNFSSKMVANGLITKAQGDAAAKKIDAMVENLENSGARNYMGIGRGGLYNFGLLGIPGIGTSELTDQQKIDLTDFAQNMANLQKELVNKMVANGSMTKEQGNAAVERIDDMLKRCKENGFANGAEMKKGRFGCYWK